jgi:hypothetical protein
VSRVQEKHPVNSADRPLFLDEKRAKIGDKSTTSSSYSQKSLRGFLVPSLSKKQQDLFNAEMALHFYMTASSFQKVEEKHLQRAISILRSDATLPTRKSLAGDLLDKAYLSLKERTDHYLQNSADWICLCTDGWTNVKGDPVVNYMATSSLGSFIIERINTGAQAHNAEWIAKDIMRVVDKITAKVAGVVTDNTNTNKIAWNILGQKYPNKFFYGCVAHCLNLLVHDVFNTSAKQKKDGEYPFAYLVKNGEECKELVKLFLNQHVLKAKLEELQERDGKQCLVRPAPTRWGTLHGCIDKIIQSEGIVRLNSGIIRLIVTASDFKAVILKKV